MFQERINLMRFCGVRMYVDSEIGYLVSQNYYYPRISAYEMLIVHPKMVIPLQHRYNMGAETCQTCPCCVHVGK